MIKIMKFTCFAASSAALFAVALAAAVPIDTKPTSTQPDGAITRPLPGGSATVTGGSAGTTHKVQVGSNGVTYYDPQVVAASAGDTIVFEFRGGNHTLTESTFEEPCKKLGGGVDTGFTVENPDGSNPGPKFTHIVKDIKPQWFHCQQIGHCVKGMVFAINPTVDQTFQDFRLNAIEKGASAPSPAMTSHPKTSPGTTTDTTTSIKTTLDPTTGVTTPGTTTGIKTTSDTTTGVNIPDATTGIKTTPESSLTSTSTHGPKLGGKGTTDTPAPAAGIPPSTTRTDDNSYGTPPTTMPSATIDKSASNPPLSPGDNDKTLSTTTPSTTTDKSTSKLPLSSNGNNATPSTTTTANGPAPRPPLPPLPPADTTRPGSSGNMPATYPPPGPPGPLGKTPATYPLPKRN